METVYREDIMGTILVQISDRVWTTKAMHLACAIARNTRSRLFLLHLMKIRSPYLLGTELGALPPSRDQLEEIEELASIAEDYGLDPTIQPMQYESLTDALAQAAVHTQASVMFAHIPESVVPFWRTLQLWNLRRQLTNHGVRLYGLDEPEQTEDWVPSVSLKSVK